MSVLDTWLDDVLAICGPAGVPEALASDRGVRFYRAASRRRRVHFFRAVFPRSCGLPGALEAALALPLGDDRDWNRNTGAMVGAVEALVASGQLPAHAVELPQHEWRAFNAGLATCPVPDERPRINPTLEIARYTRSWAGWSPGDAALRWPPPAETLIGYWLHPTTLRGRWVRLTPRQLLPLKIVGEALALAEVASETGLPIEALRTRLDEAVRSGLVLARIAASDW